MTGFPGIARDAWRRAMLVACVSSSLVSACSHTGRAGGTPPSGPMAHDTATKSESILQRESRVASAAAVAPTFERPAPLSIVTSPERETDFQAGLDLARYVAAPAGLTLDVISSKGATDNMHRLRDDPTVDLAIVQYDVLKAFLDEAARGSKAAERIVGPLRVVAPLYTQEMYFIVRQDADLKTVDQIRDRKINLGAIGSGSALSVAALYRRMFGVPIAASKASYLDERQALVALTVDRTVDVVVVIAGQPARLLADMKPEARRFIKLLAVDPERPSSRSAYRSYFPATIRAASYPQWLDADVSTFSVLSFLVTATGKGGTVDDRLDRFVQSLCTNVGVLRERGHPKWREVDVTLQLDGRWIYSPISRRQLDRCPAIGRTAASAAQ